MSEVEPIPGLMELVTGVPCLFVLVWIWVSMLKERTGSRAASIAVLIMNAPIYTFVYTAMAMWGVLIAVAGAMMLYVFWPFLLAAVVLAVLAVGSYWAYDVIFDPYGQRAREREGQRLFLAELKQSGRTLDEWRADLHAQSRRETMTVYSSPRGAKVERQDGSAQSR